MRLHLPCELLALLLLWHIYFYCFFCLFCYSFLPTVWCLLRPSVLVCTSPKCVCWEQSAEVSKMLECIGPDLQLKCRKSESQHVKLRVSRYLCQPWTAASVNSQPFALPAHSLRTIRHRPLWETRTFWVWRHFNRLCARYALQCHRLCGSESPELGLTLARSCTLNRHFDIADSKLITLGKL